MSDREELAKLLWELDGSPHEGVAQSTPTWVNYGPIAERYLTKSSFLLPYIQQRVDAADKAGYFRGYQTGVDHAGTGEVYKEFLDAAVQAERERCAGIADAEAGSYPKERS